MRGLLGRARGRTDEGASVEFGISLPTVGPVGRSKYIQMVARAADSLGFHSLWVSSHLALPAQREGPCMYPRATTADAYRWGVAWLEPLVCLGWAAALTERIRLGTHVLALPYRNPVVLAAELATLDMLSDGRAVLGVGTGWMDEEFQAIGVDRRTRGRRTDECIDALRLLWSSAVPASFEGEFTRFTDTWLAARPATAVGPPVWVGGNTPAALRRIARRGDGWLAHELYPDEIRDLRRTLAQECEAAGRDPATVRLSVRRGLVPPLPVTDFLSDRTCLAGSAEQIAEQVHDYADVGVTLLVLDLSLRPTEIVRTLEWLAAEVVPLVAAPTPAQA